MIAILIITIVFAISMLVAVVMIRYKYRRQKEIVTALKIMLDLAYKENERLLAEETSFTRQNGIGESSVLSIAGEISCMENNLYHMGDVPGRKQLMKALERMKGVLQTEKYTIVQLLGRPYTEGMMATVTFVPDESLEEGVSMIQSVKKPQVNYQGKMIQAASIIVGQYIQ